MGSERELAYMYEFHLRPRRSSGTVAVRLSVIVWPVHSTHRAAVLLPLVGSSPMEMNELAEYLTCDIV